MSLQLGPGWLQMQNQSAGELAHYAYAQNGIAVAELSIASETLPIVLTPAQYAQAIEQNVLSSLPQYQKLQDQPVNIAGAQAHYYRFTLLKDTQMGKVQMAAEQYFMVLGNSGYLITIMVLPQQFQAVKPILDQVIQSIQWGQSAPSGQNFQAPIQYPAPNSSPIPVGSQSPQNMTAPPMTSTYGSMVQNNPYPPMNSTNPYGQNYSQNPQDLNAMYEQFQKQQQQMMQQYMQQYMQQSAQQMNQAGQTQAGQNPYAMPNTDMNALVQQQMQLATLTPPPLAPSTQSQPLMNPQTIPTYPIANQNQAPANTNLTNPTQNYPPVGSAVGNAPTPLETQGLQNQANVSVSPYKAPLVQSPPLKPFQDPKQRFSIGIPENFSPAENPAGARFTGPQSREITVVEMDAPDEALNSLTKDKEVLERRDAQVRSGEKIITGKLMIYYSINPQTKQKFVVTALAVPQGKLLFMVIALEETFVNDSQMLVDVIRSINVRT
ncbi:MAG: hypothetical protein HYS07_05315 [Chlamydiae bacterium]|nr:hypothetical protein [Chlamydiota bacterium]MBI3278006.1 hypothetical protein [Chlamydiota bacterium]